MSLLDLSEVKNDNKIVSMTGDIQLYPGHNHHSTLYLGGNCEWQVGWNTQEVCCHHRLEVLRRKTQSGYAANSRVILLNHQFDPLSSISSSEFSISSPLVDHFHHPSHSSPWPTVPQHVQYSRTSSMSGVQSVSSWKQWCPTSSRTLLLVLNQNLAVMC